jgi:hypothetical protein
VAASFEQTRSELRALFQEIVDGRAADYLAQTHLQLEIECLLVVLDLVDRNGGIDDPVLGRQRDLQRDTVGAENFLSRDRHEFRPRIHLSNLGIEQREPVRPCAQDAGQSAVHVFQAAFEFEHHDATNRVSEGDGNHRGDEQEYEQAGHQQSLAPSMCPTPKGRRSAAEV